jgi:hypothetical protein
LCQEQHHAFRFNDKTITVGELSKAPESFEPQVQEHIHQELELEVDDVLNSKFEGFAHNQIIKYLYDSTISIVNWTRTIKKGEGLSNNAIDKLFSEVLLHPNFNIKDFTIKSAYNIDKHERSKQMGEIEKILIAMFCAISFHSLHWSLYSIQPLRY